MVDTAQCAIRGRFCLGLCWEYLTLLVTPSPFCPLSASFTQRTESPGHAIATRVSYGGTQHPAVPLEACLLAQNPQNEHVEYWGCSVLFPGGARLHLISLAKVHVFVRRYLVFCPPAILRIIVPFVWHWGGRAGFRTGEVPLFQSSTTILGSLSPVTTTTTDGGDNLSRRMWSGCGSCNLFNASLVRECVIC